MTARTDERVSQLAEQYRSISRSLRREAFLQQMANRPLIARIYQQYAAVARRAALAEELDADEADPRDRECGICGRVVCLAVRS